MNIRDDGKKKSELKRLIKKVNNSYISSIKEVVLQLITVINDPKSSAKDLRKIIEKDPPLTSSLLRLANSAYYGFQREISEIHEAIVAIGFNTVKELALAQKICELFKQDEDINGYSRVELWKNSVAVALSNKLTYMSEYREQGENLYVIGLLHNLGLIVEDQFLHRKFVLILNKAEKDNCDLLEAEESILGYNHADIGYSITEDWGFPEELVSAIANHHEPDKADEQYKRVTFTTFISDYICQRNEFGFCDVPTGNNLLYQKCLDEMHISEKAMSLIIDDVKKELLKMESGGWFQ